MIYGPHSLLENVFKIVLIEDAVESASAFTIGIVFGISNSVICPLQTPGLMRLRSLTC